MLNPTLVAEVLSESTEGYDRGTKFNHYRLVPSLRHVLFVSQREPRIEAYTRAGEQWALSEAAGADGQVELAALEITLPLAQVFARTTFGADSARLRPS